MSFWKPPWRFHGKQAPLRREPRTRLTLEILEDRLALSTAAASLQPVSYADWRSQTFSIENMAVAGSSGNGSQAQAQAVDAGQGEGFGQDIGLDQVVANYPFRGSGYSVAIIDTGIDYNNPALGGGWGKRVIAGYNFVNNTSDPMDNNGHGTHVAGIIGSSDSIYTGIAPNVNFIALKVLDANGSGTFGAVDQALQWVAAHQAQYHIVAVNMSLGAGNYTINPYTFLESDFSTLKSEGVFIASASGNNFYGVGSQQGLAYPAISPQVVSVGAVWDGNFGAVSWLSGARDNTTAADNITSFTQRSAGLDILAPGAMITSTYLNDTFKQMAGTSMATPVVAGAAILIHEAMDSRGQGAAANQDTILSLMQSTGVTITDGAHENDNVVNTGLSFKRLDLFAALNKVGPAKHSPPTLGTIANQTMTAGVPLVITLPAGTSNGATLTFHAQATGNGPSPAYQLGQQLGLRYAGSYFQGSISQNEKWILGTNSQWYCLMPNGDLRRWMGTAAGTLLPAALVLNLTSAVYSDPTLLWTASPTTSPHVTFSFIGNQLTIQVDRSFLGSFTVTVTAGDGVTSVSQSFAVAVTHRAPVLGVIANQSISHGKSLTVGLAASDPDGNALTFSAQAVSQTGVAVPVTLTITGNQLTIHPGPSYLGTFTVQVTVSDGFATAKQSFSVAVINAAPALGNLVSQTQNPSKSQTPGTLVFNLAASDADGDQVIFSAQAIASNQQVVGYASLLSIATLPVAPRVTVVVQGNQLTVTPLSGYKGSFYLEVTANDGFTATKKNYLVTIS